MGADEFSGLSDDQSAPAISYTILSNNSCTTGVLLPQIIDGTGVNTTTAKPRIYYKKSTDATCLLAGSS
jgi:hypothetical protein